MSPWKLWTGIVSIHPVWLVADLLTSIVLASSIAVLLTLSQARSRRLWTISLLRAFIVMAAIATICGYIAAGRRAALTRTGLINSLATQRSVVTWEPGTPSWFNDLASRERLGLFDRLVDVGCISSSELPKLIPLKRQLLVLRFAEISVSDLREVRLFENVEAIDMSAAFAADLDVEESGFPYLRQCASLRRLRGINLRDCDLTNSDLVPIGECGSLEVLDLSANEAITDAGLESLKPLKRLRHLWLAGTGVTPCGAGALQKARPQCRVEW